MAKLGILGLLEDAFDRISKSITSVDVVHRHIHDREGYVANYKALAVPNNGFARLHLKATTRFVHYRLSIGAGAKCLFNTYEGTTYSNEGTASDGVVLTTFNRVSGNDGMTAEVKYGPTISAAGVKRGNRILFGGIDTPQPTQPVSTSLTGEFESVIVPGDDVLIEVQNISGIAIDISVVVDWYEAG